jgi:hypothetical protein
MKMAHLKVSHTDNLTRTQHNKVDFSSCKVQYCKVHAVAHQSTLVKISGQGMDAKVVCSTPILQLAPPAYL